METVPVASPHVKKLEVTEMNMCRWACGHTLRDHVRNENIKERLKVESIAERCRKARLRWFGHVKRRDQEYVGRKTLEMVPPGRRKRGIPKQRWMDYVNREPSERRKTRSMTELAGGELRLLQRPQNQVAAARRRRKKELPSRHDHCHTLCSSTMAVLFDVTYTLQRGITSCPAVLVRCKAPTWMLIQRIVFCSRMFQKLTFGSNLWKTATKLSTNSKLRISSTGTCR